MPKLKIACPSCDQRLDVTGLDPHTTVGCPTCGMKMIVPSLEEANAASQEKFKIVCSHCTQHLDVDGLAPQTTVRCPSCGRKLIVPEREPGKNYVVVQAQSFVVVARRPQGVAAAAGPTPPQKRGNATAVAAKVLAFAACVAFGWSVWHFRETLFGSAKQEAVAPAAAPAAPTAPNGIELWATADHNLAAGKYNEALADYRIAETTLADSRPRRIAVRCQIGTTLYLLGKPADARKAFEGAVPIESRQGFPAVINADNFVGAVAQVVLGIVKPEAAEARFNREMPAALALMQFYLGSQSLAEGRFSDTANWFDAYMKVNTVDQSQWVLQFQDHVRPMVAELQSALHAMKEVATAQALDNAEAAAEKLNAIKVSLEANPQRAFLLSRFELIQQEVGRLAVALADDPAIKKQKEFAKERQEIERINKLRLQFAADSTLFGPAEQTAATAAAAYDFEAATTAYTSTAGRITVAELKKVAEDRAALYRRLGSLKQQTIDLMAKSPYQKPGLSNRRGGSIAGKAFKANAETISFAQQFGEIPVAWRDLDPTSLLTLFTYYGDLAAANKPAERAANFIALAWFARDLKRDATSYANYSAQLSPDAKAEWERLTGPLPEPPALPGQNQVVEEDPALAKPRIPAFMKAGGMAQALSNPNLPSLLDIVPKPENTAKK